MNDFDEILDSYYQKIYRFCIHRLGNQNDAEDATQECFTKAYKNFSSLKDQNLVKQWLYQIASNVCNDRFRSLGRFKKIIKNLFIGENTLPVESNHMILKVIKKLPKQQSEIFILRQLHDFSTEETANMLGITDGTVKSQLSRAISFLKKELEAKGFFDN